MTFELKLLLIQVDFLLLGITFWWFSMVFLWWDDDFSFFIENLKGFYKKGYTKPRSILIKKFWIKKNTVKWCFYPRFLWDLNQLSLTFLFDNRSKFTLTISVYLELYLWKKGCKWRKALFLSGFEPSDLKISLNIYLAIRIDMAT